MKRERTYGVSSVMYLVELLIPLASNEGQAFPRDVFEVTQRELVAQFGGVTAFLRAPGTGSWETPGGGVQRDAVAVIEVMTDVLDREWWTAYRAHLEERFGQDVLVARGHSIELL